MQRTVGAFEARRNFGKILQDVAARGDRVIVERHGEPIAAVVPIHVYEQWERRRQKFFDDMRAISARANVSEAESEALVKEAVDAVRREYP